MIRQKAKQIAIQAMLEIEKCIDCLKIKYPNLKIAYPKHIYIDDYWFDTFILHEELKLQEKNEA